MHYGLSKVMHGSHVTYQCDIGQDIECTMLRNKVTNPPERQKSRTEVNLNGGFEALYKDWMDAIMADDEVTVYEILFSSSDEEKNALLDPKVGPLSHRPQGKINICNGSIGEEQASEFEIDCPWILASCYGSTKVLKVLYEERVDIFYADDQGNNCLHSMVKLGALHNDLQPTMTSTYNFLLDLLTLDEIRKLLMHENARDLRPLEEAMFLETFSLFRAMFHTKDVYLIKEVRCGIQTVQYFDVTEYEDISKGNRAAKSPLSFLSMLSVKDSGSSDARDVILSQPMNTWYAVKKSSYLPLLYGWVIFRILYMALYFYCENLIFSNLNRDAWQMMYNKTAMDLLKKSNMSTMNTLGQGVRLISLSKFETCLMILALVLSIFIVLMDLFEFGMKIIRRPAWYARFYAPKSNTLVQYTFYRVVQFSVANLTLYLCVFILIMADPGSTMNINIEVLQIGYSFVVASCVWSVMFFLQLVPWLGHFVVAVQRMLGDLIKFFIIYCLFMVPYVMAFYLSLNESQDSFKTVGKAIYSTFLTMLNMVSYIEFTSTPAAVALFTIHFLYAFMVSILLINFLIAMFSSSYSDVTQNRDVIFVIQSLSVCFSLENRLMGPLKYVRQFCQRRNFVDDQGRYYITRMFITKCEPLEESVREKYLKYCEKPQRESHRHNSI